MRLADSLLRQAEHLGRIDARRPNEANLRRAVSAAYYALFHELTAEAAARIVRGTARTPHRALVRRAFTHSRLAEVCTDFSRNAEWIRRSGVEVSAELQAVADRFVLLQQRRHEADYDLDATFTRVTTRELVDIVRTTLASWRAIRGTAEAEYFLLTALLGRPRRA